MNPKTRAFLQLPQGAESFYLDEAQRHEEILKGLRDLYFHWGYLPVQTPVFDFYDIYRPLLDPSAREKIYRLIDREGDLLMLRSDVTLFLAKQMGMILSGQDLPLRVWYADTILRHQDAEDISKNEFFQVGAELIGKPGAQADLEALTLLVRSLERISLENYRVHLGSRAVFDRCFEGFPEEIRKKLLRAVAFRDREDLLEILSGQGAAQPRRDFLIRFFLFIGPAEELKTLTREGREKGYLPAPVAEAVSYLTELWDELVLLGIEGIFRLDLSEIASQAYYTGIVFQAYKEGVDSAFASGGRYDDLLARFGFDAPSVGFSILLRKIEGQAEDGHGPVRPELIRTSGKTFAEAYRAAEEARRKGNIAIIGEAGND